MPKEARRDDVPAVRNAPQADLAVSRDREAKPTHDLRHHAGTTIFRQTGNIKMVQELLNHQSITSSARYAHTNKDDLRRALKQTYGTARLCL